MKYAGIRWERGGEGVEGEALLISLPPLFMYFRLQERYLKTSISTFKDNVNEVSSTSDICFMVIILLYKQI
jgi:hypothetical protein